MQNTCIMKFSQNSGIFSNSTFKDQTAENLIQECKTELEQFETRGRSDGDNNIPKHDQRAMSGAELEIKATAEKYGSQISSHLGTIMVKMTAQLESKKRVRFQFDDNPNKVVQEKSKQQNEQFDQMVETLDGEKQGWLEIIKKEIDAIKNEIDRDLTDQKHVVDKLTSKPHKRTFIKRLRYYTVVNLAVFGDTFLIVKNLEKVAEMPVFYATIVALVLGIAIAVSGHYYGSSVKSNNQFGIRFSIILGIVTLGFFYVLRNEAGSVGIMTLGNAAMLIALALMAYKYEYDNPVLVKQYFNAEKSIKKNKKKLVVLQKKNIKLATRFGKEKQKALKKHHSSLDSGKETLKAKVIKEEESLAIKHKEFEHYYQNCLKQIDTAYKQAIRQYRTRNQAQRRDKGIPLVSAWVNSSHIDPLDFMDKGGSFSQVPAPPPPLSPPPLNNKKEKENQEEKPKSNGTPKKEISQFIVFLLLAMFGFQSCDTTPTGAAWIVLADETEKQEFQPEKIANFIMQESLADTQSMYQGNISVSISSLNEKFTNKVTTVELSDGGNILTDITHDRLDEQKDFQIRLTNSLEGAFHFSDKRPFSKLYLPICESLNELANRTEGKKFALVFSDGLENTRQYSFYRFRHKPRTLLDNAEEIVEALEKQCTLESLTGMEIIFVHQPNVKTDDLFQSAKEFWTAYFSQYGCNVRFMANL